MAEKLLINFVSDFLTDETLRCQVLKHEWKGPLDYGLPIEKVNILNSFNLEIVFEEMKKEVKEKGIDLAKKLLEITGGKRPAPLRTAAAAMESSMYQAGHVHIRKVEPAEIAAGQPTRITLLGNGFDKSPQVSFTKGTPPTEKGGEVLGAIVGSSCDLDLYQRVHVEVTLAAGTWTIQARNSDNEKWNTADVGTVTVRP